MPGDDQIESNWSGSFERETFTIALGDFVRDMVPALLERPIVRQRYDAEQPERVLAQFDFETWGRLAVLAVGPRDKFVLHAQHEEFELVTQVAFVGEFTLDALRIATFRGNLTTALLWCRTLVSSIRSESSDSPSDRLPKWAAHLN
ncbi:MAG: hypothetical protein AAGF11_43235 [Myxococcota bacterium]